MFKKHPWLALVRMFKKRIFLTKANLVQLPGHSAGPLSRWEEASHLVRLHKSPKLSN
jgi:hypothetical protein